MSAAFADISVVVPAYNPGKQILDCLSSLHALDYPDGLIEIIVVDDCSTENLEKLVRPSFPRCTFIRRSENGGCDAARADGIRAAGGSIIANTDSDCIVSPAWAERINSNLADGAAAVSGPVIHDQSLPAQLVAIAEFGHAQSMKPGTTHSFPGCNFAIRREVLEAIGYGHSQLRDGADRLLAWQLAAGGRAAVYDPEMVVYHHPSLALRPFLKRWLYYSGVTYRARKVEPGLPGGRLLGLGPMGPMLLAGARLERDYQRMVSLAVSGRLRPYLVPPLAALFPFLRAIDVAGMLGAYVRSRRGR